MNFKAAYITVLDESPRKVIIFNAISKIIKKINGLQGALSVESMSVLEN